MKMTKTLILAAGLATGLGCGYSKPATKPPAPGTMPAITQLNPASVPHNSGQFTLEVDGMNFAANATVNFNGKPEPTVMAANGKLQATIPDSAIMNAETVPVTVTNPGSAGGIYGGGTSPATSAPMNFTIN